ncbi:MAG: hypothetical protein ACK4MG_04180 [Aquabacterium sp.]
MDAATLQAKLYAGYGKAAAVMGSDFQLYRPNGSNSPLAPGNLVRTVKMALDSEANYQFQHPNEYGDATWYALTDGSVLQPGDYFRNSQGTFFVAGMQPLLPVLIVECTRLIRIVRQQSRQQVGAVGYGGIQTANELDVLGSADPATHWPASVLLGGGGSIPNLGLPGSTPAASRRVLLPPSVPVNLFAGDIIMDDLGRRLSIIAPELTELGWRINVAEIHA